MEQATLISPLTPPTDPAAAPLDSDLFGLFKFEVVGEAVPQGSKKGFVDNFGHVRVIDDNKTALNRWRKLVAETATYSKPEWLRELWDGPIFLSIVFVRERSPNDYLTDGVTLRKGAHRYPDTAPDGDKLDRAIWDALTGVLFTNDSRVVSWVGVKRFGEVGEQARTLIDVGFLR
jgi:crossover junction endodeoxyribonuclease RusA